MYVFIIKNLVFGRGYFVCLRKVIFYNNEFFVCDWDDELIKVFDVRGIYCCEIGEDLECFRGIVIDKNMGNFLIVDLGMDSIYVYKFWDGLFVGKINFEKILVSFGMNGEGNMVVCYYDSIFSVEIFFFEFWLLKLSLKYVIGFFLFL